ncbi:hypothetical protein DFJ69_1665 [Thermomonospora umbrina]|uniref:Uncharacterized protein n=1 Tax=Thermomonospora umbrina TaxID=111806 RepID=A0A3D9SJZ5_9ACTN|nr:hypothetical protein DFJ69_1665 [Thermomonospora umbrina]
MSISVQVGSIRFRVVTGPYREEDMSVQRFRPRRGLVVLLGALAVPGLVLGGAILALGPEPEPDRDPRSAVVSAEPTPTAPPPTPRTHPTFGKYVPPRPVRTAPPKRRPRPKATQPRTRPRPRQTQRPSAPECPETWRFNPFLRRWCERKGYIVD